MVNRLLWDDLTKEQKKIATEQYLSIREVECECPRNTKEFLEENPDGVDVVRCCTFFIENGEICVDI